MKLFEVDFEDNYSICIRGERKPTVEEANRFCEKDVRKFGKVVNVCDVDRDTAMACYDFTNYDNWPIFDNKRTVYVVTAFGPMIDTICEVFDTEEKALDFIHKSWSDFEKATGSGLSKEEITSHIWKTEDTLRQNVEWELHKKTID